MAYDLTRFSSQSFERFSQAMAATLLGPGVQVYGQGPDGAREFTAEGSPLIQSNGHAWDGYIVGQAKFRSGELSRVSPAKWLITQLKAEFSKFADPDRDLKPPEYYIIVTNVQLSPKSPDARGKGQGGLAEVEEWFASSSSGVALKGWQIWHADKIYSVLDSNNELRRSFSAWVTPSDILAQLLDQIGRPSYGSTLIRACARDLRHAREPKHKDTGQATQRKVPLDALFVDLPLESIEIGTRYQIDTDVPIPIDDVLSAETEDADLIEDFDPEGDMQETLSVARQIVSQASDKLDCLSLKHGGRQGASSSQVVLFGGPGQGKSTVMQFLAQLYRARNLLESGQSLTAETHEAAISIMEHAKTEGIPTQGPLRYPIHIELPKFADAMQKSKIADLPLTLLQYAAQQMSVSADERIIPSDLRSWLQATPWILLLDGLDEVPPTSNRAELISAISGILEEVAHVKADVLTIVTTRPQGYGEDLPRKHWEYWTLANLDAHDALRFAQRLADVMLEDASRGEEVMRELRRASEDPATSPIMVSPLQVGIIFSLVEVKGGVPTDRWTLFQRYYDLLRDREAAKSGADAAVLRDFRDQVDQLHHDAGFLLHVRAETAGSANPYLSDQEFRNLLCYHLKLEGHSEEEIERVSLELVRIATDRLVLLSSKVGGRIAFDVRSLQEFMAAARIMSSPERLINDRLAVIAARAHWQHVMRICASKVFSSPELRDLRPGVIVLCSSLNHGEQGRADAIIKSGSSLSLSLLVDGLAIRSPALRRALLREALDLLSVSIRDVETISLLFSEQLAPVYLDFLKAHLSSPTPIGDGSWHLALLLMSRHPAWREGEELVSVEWARTTRRVSVIAASAGYPIVNAKLLTVAKKEQSESLLTAARVAEALDLLYLEDKSIFGPMQTLSPELIDRRGERGTVLPVTSGDDKPGLFLKIMSIGQASASPDAAGFSGPAAAALALRNAFISNPSNRNLAAVLRDCDSDSAFRGLRALRNPWPLAACLSTSRSFEDLGKLADAVDEGVYADKNQRYAAEARWKLNGVSINDAIVSMRANSVVQAAIGDEGAPLLVELAAQPQKRLGDYIMPLVQELGLLPLSRFRAEVFERLVSFAGRVDLQSRASLAQYLFKLWNGNKATEGVADELFRQAGLIIARLPGSPDLYDLAEEIGRAITSLKILPVTSAGFVSEYNRKPEMRGLLPFIAMALPSVRGDNNILASIHRSAAMSEPGDSGPIAAAVMVIRLRLGLISSVDEEMVAGCFLSQHAAIERLSSPSRNGGGTELISEKLLIALVEGQPSLSVSLRRRLSQTLRSRLDRRPASFREASCCEHLSLPTPSWLEETC